jgi:hypothetical protein
MSLDALYLFLFQALSEPLLGVAAITACFGVAWVVLSALNRVGKQ